MSKKQLLASSQGKSKNRSKTNTKRLSQPLIHGQPHGMPGQAGQVYVERRSKRGLLPSIVERVQPRYNLRQMSKKQLLASSYWLLARAKARTGAKPTPNAHLTADLR